jgi:hypothetical protein
MFLGRRHAMAQIMGRPPGEIARIAGKAVLAGGKAEDIADGG